jgi:TonB-linked SusC/RagA family outer membrane protein
MEKKLNLIIPWGFSPQVMKLLLFMKLTLALLLMAIIQSFAINSYSQTTALSLDRQNATVESVLQEIESQTEFKFLYSPSVVDEARKVDIQVSDSKIDAVLDKLFNGTNVAYSINDRQIVLTQKGKDALPTDQPQLKVSGKITDTSGNALPGVTVVVKGTTTGTISDVNGDYSINNLSNSDRLIFSFVGYKTQEVAVTRKTIDVVLADDAIGIEEVVAIGYGVMKKADVTSAVSSVKSENFVKGSVKDIGQLIQGKVAGLTITSSSGDPLSNTAISLRGNTTLFGTSSNPLILIDGVPGDFNAVAPEDIESIDVLKDGSAAAIYGTRGTNGVILIATKRASGNYSATIEYNGYSSTQTIARKLEMLTAEDYRQQIEQGIRAVSDDLGATTDWLDEITQTPISQVHNFTVRGGNSNTNYLATLNYNNTEGIFQKTEKQTFNVRTDVNHTLFDGLIKLNLGLISRNIKNPNVSSTGYTYRQSIIYNPTTPIKNEDGSWFEDLGAFNYDNPVARIAESDGEFKSQWSRVNGTVIINPIEGLNLKGLVSYSKYNDYSGYYETQNHISTKRSGLNGYAALSSAESIDRLLELTAEYSKAINDHRFTLLGGYSYQDNDWHNMSMSNQEFPTDLFGYNNIDLGTGILEGGTASGIASSRHKTNLMSFFGRLNYSYKNRYLLMASMRTEAASQLYGTKDPWGSFPAMSLGWRIKEESFLKNVAFINDLKIRAGYGITGTQPSNLFLGVGTIGYTSSFYTNGVWGKILEPTRNPNPYLRWEEKKETNVGLDFAIAQNRVSGSVDYYIRTIDGLLYDYAVPVPPNQVNTTRANVGVMSNKGIEVLLNFIPVKTTDFEWNSSINFSTNSNKLVSLSNDLYQATQDYFTTGYTGEPIQTFTHRVDIGDKIGNFYGFKVVDITTDETDKKNFGKWVYEDKDGNPVLYSNFKHAFEDKQVLGNGLPKFYAGWNNAIRFKNFDFSVTMRGAFGYQILNFERMYLENTKTAQYNRLKSAYDPIFGKTALSNKVDLEYNSYYIEDGDHWKIDNITLGYTVKSSKKVVNGARVYLSSLNSYIFTNYKGIDPEVNRGGLDPGNDGRDKYPTTRTFTLGVNLKF